MLTRIEPPDRKKKMGHRREWKKMRLKRKLEFLSRREWRDLEARCSLSWSPVLPPSLSHSCSASLGGRRGLLGCMFLHTGGNGMYSIMYMRVLQRGAVWGMCAFKRESTFLHTFFFFVCPSIIMGLWDIWNDILSFSLPPFEKCLTDCNC